MLTIEMSSLSWFSGMSVAPVYTAKAEDLFLCIYPWDGLLVVPFFMIHVILRLCVLNERAFVPIVGHTYFY